MVQGIVIETKKNLYKKFKLNNSNIVVHRDVNGNLLHTYYVISYANNSNDYKGGEYCSLINLSDGYLAFKEPCLRETNMIKVLRLICGCYENVGTDDAKCNDLKFGGSYLEVFKDYELNLKVCE